MYFLIRVPQVRFLPGAPEQTGRNRAFKSLEVSAVFAVSAKVLPIFCRGKKWEAILTTATAAQTY